MTKAIAGGAGAKKQVPLGNDKQRGKGKYGDSGSRSQNDDGKSEYGDSDSRSQSDLGKSKYGDSDSSHPSERSSPGTPASSQNDGRGGGKLERLQKILAAAGVASRRKAEELILAGRVQVNGQVVAELGTKHDAGRDHIRVDGKLLKGPEVRRYFLLNKPRGYVTTLDDPQKRPTVMDLMAKAGARGGRVRLYPGGRLDYLPE